MQTNKNLYEKRMKQEDYNRKQQKNLITEEKQRLELAQKRIKLQDKKKWCQLRKKQQLKRNL